MSIFHVLVDSRLKKQVAMTNRHHTDDRPLTWDDTITLFWHPGDGLVLSG